MNHTPDTSDSDALAALRAALVIPVFVRSVYGSERIYTASPEQARTLKTLTRTDTLLPEHVRALQSLGFTFGQVADPEAKSKLGSDLFKLGASFHTPQA